MALLSALALAPGLVLVAPDALAAPSSAAVAFFSGRTEGAGQLKIVFRKAIPVRVQGTGRTESDGTLVLEQVVREGAKPPRLRRWRIHETAPGRLSGTLSDARGPVSGEGSGNRLRISYTATDGLAHELSMTFAPDGRSARNTLKVRKLGVTVAVLEETIRKID